MRKSLVMLLASLTLALGLCPAFAFAANDAEGGLSTQAAAESYTVHFRMNADGDDLAILVVDANPGTIASTAVPAAASTVAGYDAVTEWKLTDGTEFVFSDDSAVSSGSKTASKVTTDAVLVGTFTPATYHITYAYAASGETAPYATVVITQQDLKYLDKYDADSAAGVTPAYKKDDYKTVDIADPCGTSKTFDSEKYVVATAGNKGYRFTGWNTKADGTGTSYKVGQTISSENMKADIALYAQVEEVYKVTWTPKRGTAEYDNTYIVQTYTTTGEGASATKTADKVYATAPETAPTTDHYTFNGWSADGAAAFDFTTAITKNTDFTGLWTIDKVKVSFDTTIEGYTFEDKTFDYTEALTAASAFPALASTHDVTESGTTTSVAWKTGYTTDGKWYVKGATDNSLTAWDDGTKIMDDTTLYAKWSPITYKVVFHNPADSVAATNTTEQTGVEYDKETPLAANTFTNNDATFMGWATSEARAAAYTVDYEDKAAIKNLKDTQDAQFDLYAVWQPTYTVTFAANLESGEAGGFVSGGTEAAPTYATTTTQEIPVNAQDAKLKTVEELKLTTPNYTFNEWVNSTDSTLKYADGAAFISNAGSGENAATLNATWKPKTYSVDFDANGGTLASGKTAPATQYMQYGVGRVNAAGNAINQAGEEKPATGSWTQYKAIDLPSMSTNYGATANVFERTGYTFAGWNTKADGTGDAVTAYASEKTVTANVTLYAQWTANSVTVTYDEDSASPAPSVPGPVTYTYGATTGTTEWTFPTLEGYGKTGNDAPTVWTDGTKEYTPGEKFTTTTFDASVVLKPKWVAKKFTITFKNIDDAATTLRTESVEYGQATQFMQGKTPAASDTPVYPEESKQYTFTFSGWLKAADLAAAKAAVDSQTSAGLVSGLQGSIANVTEDATYYAYYTRTPNTFTVTFEDGGVGAAMPTGTATPTTGKAWHDKVTEPTSDPEAAGYEFAGWFEKAKDGTLAEKAFDFANTELEADVTIVATWTNDKDPVAVPEAQEATFDREPKIGVKAGEHYTLAAGALDGSYLDENGNVVAVNAGDYEATATVEEGYLWEDGTADAKTIEWSIAKDEDAANALPAELKLADASQLNATELLASIVVSADGSDVYVDQLWLTEADRAALDDAVKSYIAAKEYYLGATKGDTDKMNAAYQTAAGKVQAGTKKYSVAVPKAVTGLKYNGKTLTGVKAGANYTLKANTGKAAKTYTATATLKDTAKYQWSDGTTAAKKVKWTIAKAANTVTVKAKAVKAKAKKKATVAAKKAFTVSKAQGKVTYKKASGNKKITVSKAGKITIAKGLKKGTYSVKVKVTAAGNGNYKAATKTVTVKITLK